MSEAYERVKGGRLTFKGGALATRTKDIDKNKKKKKSKKTNNNNNNNNNSSENDAVSFQESPIDGAVSNPTVIEQGSGAGETYTIDPMKKMKYDELFPVETRKFGYDPKANTKSVEEALDDRVKKKADRYCK